MPSQASISRVLTSDLGYSYKRLTIVPKESLTDNVQERLEKYLTICSACDPRNMHFFDENVSKFSIGFANSSRNWLLGNLVPNFPTNVSTRRGKVM